MVTYGEYWSARQNRSSGDVQALLRRREERKARVLRRIEERAVEDRHAERWTDPVVWVLFSWYSGGSQTSVDCAMELQLEGEYTSLQDVEREAEDAFNRAVEGSRTGEATRFKEMDFDAPSVKYRYDSAFRRLR